MCRSSPSSQTSTSPTTSSSRPATSGTTTMLGCSVAASQSIGGSSAGGSSMPVEQPSAPAMPASSVKNNCFFCRTSALHSIMQQSPTWATHQRMMVKAQHRGRMRQATWFWVATHPPRTGCAVTSLLVELVAQQCHDLGDLPAPQLELGVALALRQPIDLGTKALEVRERLALAADLEQRPREPVVRLELIGIAAQDLTKAADRQLDLSSAQRELGE